MTKVNITDLNKSQITAINEFLTTNHLAPFSKAQLHFIKNMDDLDVLGLSQNCIGIRGFFLEKSNNDFYTDQNGRDYDELIEDFLFGLDKDDYSETDYKELKSERRSYYKAQMVHHALILSSSNADQGLLLLYLNKQFEPLYAKQK